MFSHIFLILSIISTAFSIQASSKLGFQHIRTFFHVYLEFTLASKNNRSLPLFHLPYATYRASKYDPIDDIYTFSNIRFAAPPTGKNRFRLPQRPLKQARIQDGSKGNMCYQSVPTQFLVARPAVEEFTQSEDCLFLDIFVPGHIVRSEDPRNEKLAVVHWIFGGGFGLCMVLPSYNSAWNERLL